MTTSHETKEQINRQYWRMNIMIMTALLSVWALVGLGGGILFADILNRVTLPNTGLPLGFWMAHQGSIIGFVFIILIYCVALNRLDRRHRQQIANLSESES
ncbi:MAG: DUF4212 domain-containing protein [Rhodothermales bacterium]|nr:DUF4212 domain-containing protein [Rhodothermales bacterium]